jgi:hypothetical protein
MSSGEWCMDKIRQQEMIIRWQREKIKSFLELKYSISKQKYSLEWFNWGLMKQMNQ